MNQPAANQLAIASQAANVPFVDVKDADWYGSLAKSLSDYSSETMETELQNLYIQFKQSLLNFVNSKVNNYALAEDIVQEVFLRVIKSNILIDETKSISSLLYTITKNTISDYFRNEKIKFIPIDDNLDATLENNITEIDPVFCSISNCIKKMILKLPENYQNVLILSEIEQIEQKLISKKLHLPYSNVKSKIQRGRKMLRSHIQSCCEFDKNKGQIIKCKNACHKQEDQL